MQKKVDYLVDWLRDQVAKTNTRGLVVGLSGGIDSAVVAYLIKQALPNHSLAVIMPCQSSKEDLKDAQAVVEGANIKAMTIDLTLTHQQLLDTIKHELIQKEVYQPNHDQLASANLKARLRMSTLYTIATNHQYLVVGTDNAAEWYTGYFTKYGDGGVDINPLVHLTKGEVREMAHYLNVAEEIILKQPSAGLWDGQTDENEMGTTYDYIDGYLKGEEIPEQDRKVIEAMHQRSKHKRSIVITPAPFDEA